MKNKRQNRVSLAYKRMPPTAKVAFIGWIISCMKGNPAFPNPPVPLVPATPPDPDAPVDMTTRKDSLDAANTAAVDGGTVDTAARNAADQFACDGLDALAFYVQTTCRYDLPTFLTSGFQVVSNNHGQSQLDTPTITGIDNDISTQLAVHITSILNAIGYEIQISTTGNDWKTVKFSPQARTAILTGLTTGQVVQVRARALGGSTGQSDWSKPSSSIVD